MPGSRIPVVSPDELLAMRPDYVLILPWNLRAEVAEQLSAIRAWGGRFVTAIPTCLSSEVGVVFEELPVAGAFRILLTSHADERGSFARLFSQNEMREAGLTGDLSQISISLNRLRGHRARHASPGAPHAETKIITCVAGGVLDAIVDLRRDSTTYLRTATLELSAENATAIYCPTRLRAWLSGAL
jgi:hypothetical protein